MKDYICLALESLAIVFLGSAYHLYLGVKGELASLIVIILGICLLALSKSESYSKKSGGKE